MCCPIFGRYAGYECTNSQQIAIPNAVATLHIPPMPLSPNSDFNFFFGRYFQIGKCIIALSLICATRFLINSFHRGNLLYFIVSFYRRFLEKTNALITVLMAYIEQEYEPFDPYSCFSPRNVRFCVFLRILPYTHSAKAEVGFLLALNVAEELCSSGIIPPLKD